MSNRKPRVALIRNRVYPGGVFHVMAEMTAVLNQMGIKPDIVTLRSKVSPEKAFSSYDLDVDFNVREIYTDVRIPYEWHILLFNAIAKRKLLEYDIVINHNNTSFLLDRSRGQQLISYVHFPRKARGLAKQQSIHDPASPPKRWYHLRTDFLKLASNAYRFDNRIDTNETILANSAFTKRQIIEAYPQLEAKRIGLLYPPVDLPARRFEQEQENNVVASLGRFSPEKQQLRQIEIASRLPQLQFRIMGFIGDREYFEQCRSTVTSKGLGNVSLLPDLPFDQVENELRKASFFLHAVPNEPFGITTVKAIANGCIPIVPDSGGQPEIVTEASLRYNTIEEGVQKLREAESLPDSRRKTIRDTLFSNIRQFDREHFQHTWKSIIAKVMENSDYEHA